MWFLNFIKLIITIIPSSKACLLNNQQISVYPQTFLQWPRTRSSSLSSIHLGTKHESTPLPLHRETVNALHSGPVYLFPTLPPRSRAMPCVLSACVHLSIRQPQVCTARNRFVRAIMRLELEIPATIGRKLRWINAVRDVWRFYRIWRCRARWRRRWRLETIEKVGIVGVSSDLGPGLVLEVYGGE